MRNDDKNHSGHNRDFIAWAIAVLRIEFDTFANLL